MSPGDRRSTTTICSTACCTCKLRAHPAPPCAHPAHRHLRSRTDARRASRSPRHGRAGQPQHTCSADRLRPGRRAAAGRKTRCATRASRSSRSSPTPSARHARVPRRRSGLCGVLPHVLDVEEALKPGAPVVNEPTHNTFDYHDHTTTRSCASAMSRRRFARPTTSSKHATRCRRSSTHRSRPTAPSPRPKPTTATSATPPPRRCSSRSAPPPSCWTCRPRQLHFIGGTVGGGFGGKVDIMRRADWRSSAPC